MTAIGSVPEPLPTTTTSTLALISLALTILRRGIEQRGGERAATRLSHRRRGHCCWRRLHLRLQDKGAEEDGRGNRQGRHANIRSREEVGRHNPIFPCA